MRFRLTLFVALSFSLSWMTATAQEYRASITGTVSDPSGAHVIGAKVTLHNVETGVDTAAESDKAGDYNLNFIDPGYYVLTAEAPGFQRWEVPKLRLDTAQAAKVNISFRVSDASSSVTVVAESVVLEGANANVAQLFDSKDVSDFPLAEGNPVLLLNVLGGSVYTSGVTTNRVFDAVGQFRMNGVPGANFFYLNGVPDNGVANTSANQNIAFVPPTDAVDQVKVLSSAYTATVGFTAGANVNFNTKSGTDHIVGSAYEYFENEALDASSWIVNHLGQRKAQQRSNNFGGTIGGPVVVPYIYNGRKKTFFFGYYQYIKDAFPQPTNFLVPTAKMRTGDLSEICTGTFTNGLCSNASQQLYNPFAASATTGGHVKRQPLLNNQIPANLLNPIGLHYLSYFPLPNIPGVPADGSSNYYANNGVTDGYYGGLVRIDHYFSGTHHLAGDYFQSHRANYANRWAGQTNGLYPGAFTLFQENHGVGITDTLTLSSTMVLDMRIGFNRFEKHYTSATAGLDLTTLGYTPAQLAQLPGPYRFPNFTGPDFSTLIANNPSANPSNEYSASVSLSKALGKHLFALGYDAMLYRVNSTTLGNNFGTFAFAGSYASATDTATNVYGMGIADLLVGQPTSGSLNTNASYADQVVYHAGYLQDDFKATSKLTVTAGLRYEFEGAPTERFNRNTRGFDLTSANPVQSGAQAAFATAFPTGLNVGTGLPVKTDFSATGGFTYADSGHRGFFNADHTVFLPRVGIAYAVHDNTIVRGGWGLYKSPFVTNENGAPDANQTGFSQTTTFVPTTNSGLTFTGNLSNPFPSGIAAPTGSSLGLNQNLGSTATFWPLDPPTEYTMRWSAEVQQGFPKGWVVDLLYVGAKGWNIPTNSNFADAVPAAYFSTMPTRDTTLISALTKTVANPFKGLLGPTSVNSTALNTGATTTVSQLLRPRPQFTGLTMVDFVGTINYESGQARVIHRFNRGISFNSLYTWSKSELNTGFNNDFQVEPNHNLSPFDITQQLIVTVVGELPFGRKRAYFNKAPMWADYIIGGWQASGIYTGQSGFPLDFGDVYYSGDPHQLHFNYDHSLVGTGTPLLDVSGFYLPTQANGTAWPSAAAQRADSRITLANNIRYFPGYMSNTRSPAESNLDIGLGKKFAFGGPVNLEFRASAINALNHPWFANPVLTPSTATFGTLSGTQKNNPREMIIYARLTF